MFSFIRAMDSFVTRAAYPIPIFITTSLDGEPERRNSLIRRTKIDANAELLTSIIKSL
jgi:hypothetical protein